MPLSSLRHQRGFSLVELMISIVISLLVLAGLSAMLVNVSNTNSEMAKSNSQIENGRFAIQVLESDIAHAGFWGEHVPQFDDQNWPYLPVDVPTVVPDPCLSYSATNWDFTHVNNLIGIPIASSDGAIGTCTLASRKTDTDALVVRHAATCVPGQPNCALDTTGKLYHQAGMCAGATAGTAQLTGNDSTHIKLQPPSSIYNTEVNTDAYVGMTIRITAGTGAGQTRTIDAYDGITFIARVSSPWATTPTATSAYNIVDNVLSTSSFPLRSRLCGSSAAAKRKFESNIYYIRDYASTAGDGIPTLVRSSFDPDGAAALAHQAEEPLVEGIERFQVEFGIDDTVNRCNLASPVDYTVIVSRVNTTTCAFSATLPNTLPRNRGDGNPDRYVRCTSAVPCGVAQLSNAVAAKLFLLVRNNEVTRGYTDPKTYCLATILADGTCPSGNVAGPFTDGYKRHLFSTTIRLTTVSGRREAP